MGNTLFQRVTQILRKPEPVPAPVPVVEEPVETEEHKQARLEAYRKFCEQQAQVETPEAKKKMKFRAKDFNP